jgi:hypothetical protein
VHCRCHFDMVSTDARIHPSSPETCLHGRVPMSEQAGDDSTIRIQKCQRSYGQHKNH